MEHTAVLPLRMVCISSRERHKERRLESCKREKSMNISADQDLVGSLMSHDVELKKNSG